MATDTSMTRSSTWFLYSEDGEPLGQVFRAMSEAIPSVGDQLADGARWSTATVVSYEELRQSCGLRRFRVVVRVLS